MAFCLKCKCAPESETVHDLQTCDCGNVSVDGGKEYIKRSVKNFKKYVDLSKIKFEKGDI